MPRHDLVAVIPGLLGGLLMFVAVPCVGLLLALAIPTADNIIAARLMPDFACPNPARTTAMPLGAAHACS